jgi:hypothetical protein
MTHSANLSKIFWPNPERGAEYVARGELMRRLYAVGDESPLESRKVRNGFEHLDERLHQWMTEPRKSVIDQFISLEDPGSQYDDSYILRIFNVRTGDVTVGNATINLPALSREADRLYERGKVLRSELGELAKQAGE